MDPVEREREMYSRQSLEPRSPAGDGAGDIQVWQPAAKAFNLCVFWQRKVNPRL
jgi:hypothetical protein